MNTKFKKGIINTSIFMFFVLITFYVIFKNNDIEKICNIITQVDIKFILIAILCMICFIVVESTNIVRIVKLLGDKISIFKGIKYALIGFFFSSVSPGASGGQPMQVYFMKKDGLQISRSTLAILTEAFSFQLCTLLLVSVAFISHYHFIENSIGNLKFLIILGMTMNVVILVFLMLVIFSKKIIAKIIEFVCGILHKCHYKKEEQFREKCFEQIEEYKAGAKALIANPKALIKIFLTTLVQLIFFHSIPYFVYLSFGFSEATFFTFLSVQLVLYITVSLVPVPGAVGVSEGGFLVLYKLLFPVELISSAMLLSRGINFYLFVLISGVVSLYFSLKKK